MYGMVAVSSQLFFALTRPSDVSSVRCRQAGTRSQGRGARALRGVLVSDRFELCAKLARLAPSQGRPVTFKLELIFTCARLC